MLNNMTRKTIKPNTLIKQDNNVLTSNVKEFNTTTIYNVKDFDNMTEYQATLRLESWGEPVDKSSDWEDIAEFIEVTK